MKKAKIWMDNVNNLFSGLDDNFIKTFREPGNANGKMTAWNANEPTSRWFKFFLFNIVNNKKEDFFENYKKLGETSLGNPINVKSNGCYVNLDYLLGIEEFMFIKNNISEEIKTIVEIGSGFGRTSHVFIKLLESLDKYVIIDLPELLSISKIYLKSVLTDFQFSKIEFYENNNKEIENIKSDLVININSFQEMPSDVIDYYMNSVIKNSNYFFSRNAICKYKPSTFNITDESNLLDVFELGYCKELIDVFDDEEIKSQTNSYIKKYNPLKWSIVNGETDIFSYYYKILYKK